MPSDVDICNLALLRIGHTQRISSLNAASIEAQTCKALLQPAIDANLAACDWRFAAKRAALAALEGPELLGWHRVFALPTDCLAVRSIDPLSGSASAAPYSIPNVPLPGVYASQLYGAGYGREEQTAAQRIPYAVEALDDGTTVLACDLESPTLRYTARVGPAVFPPLFIQALVWHLAGELALAIPKKEGLSQRCFAMWERAFDKAVTASASQGQRGAPAESPYITVRE